MSTGVRDEDNTSDSLHGPFRATIADFDTMVFCASEVAADPCFRTYSTLTQSTGSTESIRVTGRGRGCEALTGEASRGGRR